MLFKYFPGGFSDLINQNNQNSNWNQNYWDLEICKKSYNFIYKICPLVYIVKWVFFHFDQCAISSRGILSRCTTQNPKRKHRTKEVKAYQSPGYTYMLLCTIAQCSHFQQKIKNKLIYFIKRIEGKRSEQFLVTKYLFNLFLEVSQI